MVFMENTENKIIRDKINSIDKLPNDYPSILDSKFELLITGIQKSDKKRSRKWIYIPWGIAAGIALMILINLPQNEKKILIEIPSKPAEISINKVDINKSDTLQSNKVVFQKYLKKNSFNDTTTESENIVLIEEPVQDIQNNLAVSTMDTTVVSEVVKVENTIQPKLKRHRFTEIDFNDNPKIEPDESGYAAKRSKVDFKFNINNNKFQSVSAIPIQFKKDF